MTGYRIYVRDASLERVAEVSDFNRMALVLRFNAPGWWALDLPHGTDAAAALMEPGAGVVVRLGGEVLLSGSRTTSQRSWAGGEEEFDRLMVGGPDDLVWLSRRLAPPVPSGPPYGGAEHDVRTGPAETVIRQYVDLNAGPGATAPRRVPALVLAPNEGRGAAVTGRARFNNLMELVAFLALAGGGLGVRITQKGTDLEFAVYEPADRTAAVRFKPSLGNLRAFERTRKAPAATYVYVGGGGDGAARTFVEGGDAAGIIQHGRIETFRDRRDTTDAAELAQQVQTSLEELGPEDTLELTPIDIAELAFGTHYGLGDRVTAVVDEQAIEQVIREVHIDLLPDGEVVRPVLAGPEIAQQLGFEGGAGGATTAPPPAGVPAAARPTTAQQFAARQAYLERRK